MLGVSFEEMSPWQWKLLVHNWRSYNESSTSTQTHYVPMDKVFANCSKEDKIYPLTTAEIEEA
jgi:hypothetical protein